jgi:hypothetical protein
MADDQRSFVDRWMDILPASTNIDDRRNDPYRGSVSLYRKNDRGIYNIPPAPHLPGPGPGQGDLPMGLLGPLGAATLNPLGIVLSGFQAAGRDTPEMLASKKERANKIRGAYNNFFDTPGQKAAMEDKNVTPLTPGDSYYNKTLNFSDPSVPFVGPAPKSGNPWWLDLAKQLGGMPGDKPAPPAAPAGYVDQGPPAPPPPGPPMSLAPPNPGPSSGPGVVPPMRMPPQPPVTGNPDLPNMVDPNQLPQQGLFARTVMDPNTGGMMNDFATKRPGDDLAGLFRSLIGK